MSPDAADPPDGEIVNGRGLAVPLLHLPSFFKWSRRPTFFLSRAAFSAACLAATPDVAVRRLADSPTLNFAPGRRRPIDGTPQTDAAEVFGRVQAAGVHDDVRAGNRRQRRQRVLRTNPPGTAGGAATGHRCAARSGPGGAGCLQTPPRLLRDRSTPSCLSLR